MSLYEQAHIVERGHVPSTKAFEFPSEEVCSLLLNRSVTEGL